MCCVILNVILVSYLVLRLLHGVILNCQVSHTHSLIHAVNRFYEVISACYYTAQSEISYEVLKSSYTVNNDIVKLLLERCY